jgi:hypothetical protein
MTSGRMFLSMTSLTDPSRHREYNAWHQLDHLPENLLQPGVLWGDRWVISPDCAPYVTGRDREAGHQYAIMYWFRAPEDISVARWTELNQTALWWGRRPELGWTRRAPVGFFRPVKAYAAAPALVRPEAIPLRPHSGVHMTISRLRDPGAPGAVTHMAAYDRHRLPAILALPGVAGASTYAFHSPAQGFGAEGADGDRGLLIRLIHLDGDPISTTEQILSVDPGWIVDSEHEEIVHASPFRSIAPHQWNWFDGRE